MQHKHSALPPANFQSAPTSGESSLVVYRQLSNDVESLKVDVGWAQVTLKRSNGQVDCDHQSGDNEDYFWSARSNCDLAGDAIQEESHLLVSKCSHWPARVRGIFYARHQEEPGVEMVKIPERITSCRLIPA